MASKTPHRRPLEFEGHFLWHPVPPGGPREHGNRLAQENVRQRLAACFGARGVLTIEAEPEGDMRYTVRVSVPLEAP